MILHVPYTLFSIIQVKNNEATRFRLLRYFPVFCYPINTFFLLTLLPLHLQQDLRRLLQLLLRVKRI